MKIAHYLDFLSDRYHLQNPDGTVLQEHSPEKEVTDGLLVDINNPAVKFRISGGIPRFLRSVDQNYSENFGYQWNQFKFTQFDSASGLSISSDRFWQNSKWSPEELKGKKILEVGSGAGRFTEILAKTGAMIFSFDLSNAVEANYANNGSNPDLFLFQGDIFDIPFPDNYFDFVLCYGVLQHTPDPDKAYQAIYSKLKPGGKISIDYYRKFDHVTPWSTPKYFWRPITRKMPPKTLLKIIRFYMPLWLPVDTLLRKIPKVGEKIVSIIPIPCWNYLHSGFTYKQRLQWAILDTFDALAPTYDLPKTKEEVEAMVQSPHNAAVELFYGGTGIVANVLKR
jgi:SAM-dependent methyltransferase